MDLLSNVVGRWFDSRVQEPPPPPSPTPAADYVEGGGAYLGLCAGAYYACARVEFEPGSRCG